MSFAKARARSACRSGDTFSRSFGSTKDIKDLHESQRLDPVDYRVPTTLRRTRSAVCGVSKKPEIVRVRRTFGERHTDHMYDALWHDQPRGQHVIPRRLSACPPTREPEAGAPQFAFQPWAGLEHGVNAIPERCIEKRMQRGRRASSATRVYEWARGNGQFLSREANTQPRVEDARASLQKRTHSVGHVRHSFDIISLLPIQTPQREPSLSRPRQRLLNPPGGADHVDLSFNPHRTDTDPTQSALRCRFEKWTPQEIGRRRSTEKRGNPSKNTSSVFNPPTARVSSRKVLNAEPRHGRATDGITASLVRNVSPHRGRRRFQERNSLIFEGSMGCRVGSLAL